MYEDVLLSIAPGAADDGHGSRGDSSANGNAASAGAPALERALDLADRHDATLHVLSAVDPTVFDPMTVDIERLHEALETEAEKSVDAAAERARERGVDVERRIGHGPPALVVTDYADLVDVVVMATHGREGLKHALLGSVTEKVLRHSPAPVLTVPR